ncbi:MAG: hypothetical protein JSR37_01405 [Verrucomicrobia bacterium]|nr:hypothetical protein [Verrucomicrobiota bacterium]MBS0636988.1 hypothetical protein [Verrucomicrobiota bacterium]
MGNPNVSGLGPNWYIDGNWVTAASDASSSQSDYDTTLTALNTASSAYLTAKDNLINAYATGVKATITAAKNAFDAARGTLANALNNMQTSYASQAAAATAVQQTIDTKFDSKMTNYANTLSTALANVLTLPETVPTNLDVQFAAANTARIASRLAAYVALSAFYSSQNSLNNALNNYQANQDLLMSLQAKYNLDQAPPAASAATLAADVANITAQTAVVSSLSTSVSSLTSQRDAALASFQAALGAYNVTIDTQVAVLNQSAVVTNTNVDQFLEDLQAAKNAALISEQAALDAIKNADTVLRNQLLGNFPNVDPTISNQIQNAQDGYINDMLNLSSSTLAAPVDFNTQLSIPLLPPAGKMSMSQLMQFITVVQLLLDQLIREIRRTDSRVNELRLTIFEAASSNDAAKANLQSVWADKLLAADTAYNETVAENNTKNIADAVAQLNYFKDHPEVINDAIDQLNSEIDDQNARGAQIVSALNSAIQMAADNYKVQLWADHTQLQDNADKLQSVATLLASSDPLKAPLQNVVNLANAVIADQKAITGLLSVRPIDETAIGAAQSQFAADNAALTNAIGALPSTTTSTLAAINGVTNSIGLVSQDQLKLQNFLHNSEVNAAKAFADQATSERTRLSNYSQDITRIMGTLSPDDPNIPKLTDYLNAIAAATSALDTLTTDLTTLPINLTTLINDRIALQSAISDVTTAKNSIAFSGLTKATQADLNGVDEVLNNIGNNTLPALDLYTFDTTTIQTIPPALPGQVRTALMPPPLQLKHLPLVQPGDITIPAALDTPVTAPPVVPSPLPSGSGKVRKPGPQPLPPPPNPTDVASLNDAISDLNQLLAPVIDRIHAAGNTKAQLIKPILVRQYVPVRDPSTFIDSTVLDSYAQLLDTILQTEQAKEGTDDNPPAAALVILKDFIGNPNVTTGGTKATGVGAGTGLEGANLATSAGNIATSLTSILESTGFANYVRDIFQKSGVVAGLAAISKLQQAVGSKVATPGVLTEEQKTALAVGVKDLLTTTQDVPKIKSELLALLKSLGTQNLSDEEIQQLLSILLFLLQLLALLVAAVAVAAGGGGTSISPIVQKGFEKPEDTKTVAVVNELRTAGVQNLPAPEIAPSNPQFVPQFVEAVNNALTPAQQLGFVAKIEQVFTQNGVTLPKEKPLAQAIKEALVTLPANVAGKVRELLTKVTTEESQRLLLQPRNTITEKIKQLNPTGFAAIPPEQAQTIAKVLEKAGPKIQVPGLPPEERNNLVLAVLGGVITPTQAKGLVDEFLKEGALKTNPVIGNLIAKNLSPQVLGKPGELAKPGEPGKPGELPDTASLIAEGFKALSKQTTDQNFSEETVNRFASSIEGLSNFYQKSLDLILDPANTYVKNFSIVTRQTSGHDNLGSVSQIPISG